ncbi:MAG: MiaB family RNA methyltransferase, partial [Thermus sp.]
ATGEELLVLGHTPDYYEVRARGVAQAGEVVRVRVEGVEGYALLGQVAFREKTEIPLPLVVS